MRAANSSKIARRRRRARTPPSIPALRRGERRSPRRAAPRPADRPAWEGGQAALRVRHHPVLLRPLRGGQEDVGEARRLGRVIGVLHDDQLGLAERLLDEVQLGHGGGGIGADDPHRAHLAAREPLEDLQRGAARRGRDPPGRARPSAARPPRAPRGRSPVDSRAGGGERPPVSRPPIALGWPVSEKGPAPGRPIWPVARCRLMMAAFLSVPDVALVDAHAPEGQRARARRPKRRARLDDAPRTGRSARRRAPAASARSPRAARPSRWCARR